MARYGVDHKAVTRQRLIEAAGRRFKRDGIDGAGVATLVSDAGLTNGAFYGHFTSKDDLVAAVVADQLAVQRDRIEAVPTGAHGVEAFVREYLSPQHRDDFENGCPSAALLDEFSRCELHAREAYTRGIRPIIELISDRLPITDRDTSYGRATGLMTLLIATLQLSRVVNDTELSESILNSGIANALALAQIADSSTTDSEDKELR